MSNQSQYSLISISHLFYPSVGGVQVISANLQRYLTKRYGISCLTVTVNNQTQFFNYDQIDCIQYAGRLMFGGDYSLPSWHFVIGVWQHLRHNPSAAIIIHGRHFITSIIATVIAKLQRRQYIYVEHGFTYQAYNSQAMEIVLWILDKFVFWIVPAFAATIITNSETTKSLLLKQLGSRNQRAIAIQNGYSDILWQSKLPQKENIVLWAGRWTAVKDPTTVLRAYNQLASEFPTWQFKLIGNGDITLSMLKSRVATLQNNIKIINQFLPQEELHALMSKSKIYINSSLSEGFAMATSEAGALGNALVLSDIPANAEWMHLTQLILGQEVFLFPVKDYLALAKTLRSAIASAEPARLVPNAIQSKLAVLRQSVQFDKYYELINRLRIRQKSSLRSLDVS